MFTVVCVKQINKVFVYLILHILDNSITFFCIMFFLIILEVYSISVFSLDLCHIL